MFVILWYNGDNKKSTSGRSLRLVRGGVNLRFLGADHNLDHLQVWTTWELWTLRHKKARVSDEKARKSTQNEAKNRCFCVWDVDAAGSNPVTPTKIAVLTAVEAAGETLRLFANFTKPVVRQAVAKQKIGDYYGTLSITIR